MKYSVKATKLGNKGDSVHVGIQCSGDITYTFDDFVPAMAWKADPDKEIARVLSGYMRKMDVMNATPVYTPVDERDKVDLDITQKTIEEKIDEIEADKAKAEVTP